MDNLLPGLHWTNLLIIPALLVGYTVHELGHAFTAYFLGDYSQVERGKITLNPFRHISWFGSLAFVLFGIGWPNALQANAQNFKNKHLGMFLTAVAGPVASFTLALTGMLLTLLVAAMLVYGSGATTDQVFAFLFPTTTNLPENLNVQALAMAFTGNIAIVSFWLTLTSLIPLPRMDGFVILVSLIALLRGQQQPGPAIPAVTVSTSTNLRPLINQYKRRNNVSDIHFKLGTEYHQTQKYDDAIARYRQAISTDQNFGPAYVNLGLAYLAKGKRREAIHAFRGAVQYADDQKSQSEAWFQLHQLSEVSPVDEPAAQESMAEMGASPWTDTKPRPNWLGLSVVTGILFVTGLGLYGYLISGAIEMLKV